VFSDETKISRFNLDGRMWCWIEDKENIHIYVVNQTIQHGGGILLNMYRLHSNSNGTPTLVLLVVSSNYGCECTRFYFPLL